MKKQTTACLMILFLLAGCEHLKPKPAEPPKVEAIFNNIDKFYDEIAARVKRRLGADKVPDFIVIPSEASWPIGTVLRPGTTFPADATACVATEKQIVSADTPNLFPDYANTYKNSIDLGIDNELIKKLVDAGVKLKDKDEVTFKVAESKLELIDDTTYNALSSKVECKSVLSGKELWVVRGYAIGKRSFVFGSEIDRTGKAKIEKIASFDVDFGSGNSSLKVTDEKPAKFVQIISAVKIEQGVTKSFSPLVPVGTGRVFIQKDRQDASRASQTVVNSLRTANFKVESNVESIDSSKMPRGAQVRFFNENDRELANKAAETLKSQFPDISVLKLKLPAPTGQLEVWLPRSGNMGS